MPSGSNDSSYFIRALPGAGKNFLASLICNKANILHHNKIFNEYFNSADLIKDKNGPSTMVVWDEYKWKFISVKTADGDSQVRHRHELGTGQSAQCYITHQPEDLDFVRTLFFIKSKLGGPAIAVFNRNASSYNLSKELSTHKDQLPRGHKHIYSVINEWKGLSQKNILLSWIQFVTFIKDKVPMGYPFSRINIAYFSECILQERFEIDNTNHYLMFIDEYKDIFIKTIGVQFNMSTEKELLDQYNNDIYYEKEQAQYVKRSNITILQYNELFTGKKTNTVFDNFKDELLLYNERNIALVKRAEDFYGPLR